MTYLEKSPKENLKKSLKKHLTTHHTRKKNIVTLRLLQSICSLLLLAACSHQGTKSTSASTLETTLPVGALVITQSKWHTQNTQFLANPASLMKLITATVAASELGADYRFQTQLIYPKASLKRGHLYSPLTLVMQGDPMFKVDDLRTLLQEVKESGVKTLNRLDIDVSHYDGNQWAIGQVWNDHGVCFAAPVSAAIINRNCSYGNIKTEAIGEKTRFYLTPDSPLTIENDVVTAANEESDSCEFLLKIQSLNHYKLTGCLPEKEKKIPLGFSTNAPTLFLMDLVRQELSRLGFGNKVKIRIIDSPSNRVKAEDRFAVFTHHSVTSSELIYRMLQRSDNLVADSLFKKSGYQYGVRQNLEYPVGSYASGEEAALFVLDQLHISSEYLVLRDGSGLSRENLVFADTFYQILKVWQDDPKYKWLIDLLPVSGVSGTLKERESVINSPLKDRVLAKTGTMHGVRNLAGFVELEDGLAPFVLMVNKFSRPTKLWSDDDSLSEQEMRLYDFERNFLQEPLTE